MRRLSVWLVLLLPLMVGATAGDLKTRLLVGEVQYLAQQQRYLEALMRVDGARHVNRQILRRTLQQQKRDGADEDGEDTGLLSLADIELGYRMSQRAGSAVQAVLGGKLSQQQRNRAAFQLANIYYDKQQYDYARYALQLIRGELFYPFNHDVLYLQAKIDARTGNHAAAIEVFDKLQYDDRFRGFAAYNLAHSLLADGQLQEGLEQMATVGDMFAHDEVLLSLRDKANLVLGYQALQGDAWQQAIGRLSKVRLQSAFANKALLGIAWANMSLQDYRAAIPAWSELHRRDAAHAAVREAWLALPYNYGKLGAHGKAVELYEFAIAKYENVLQHMRSAVEAISSGAFFRQLASRPLRASDAGLLSLGRAPTMAYLEELLTRPGFQQGIKNLIELNEMQAQLQQWERSSEALAALVERREQQARSLRQRVQPELEALGAQLETASRQGDALSGQLTASEPDAPLLLANADERIVLASLRQITLASETLPPAQVQAVDLQRRVQRARGVIDWQIEQQAGARRQQLQESLQRIGAQLQELQARHARTLTRLRRASNIGVYKVPLFTLKKQLAELASRLQQVAQQQRDSLRDTMLQTLQQRKQQVENYLVTARYELAKNYDLLAAKEREAQAAGGVTDESATAP